MIFFQSLHQRTTGNADPPLYPAYDGRLDPPDTNIILAEYQATSENLPELNGRKPAKAEAKKEIHFPSLGLILSYLR